MPLDGTLTFEALAEDLAALCELACVPQTMCVRSVAFQDREDGWFHLATVAAPARYFPPAAALIKIGKIALISSEFEAASVKSTDDLIRFLTYWRQALQTPGGFPFQETINVDRWNSHNSFIDEPAWACRLYEKFDDRFRPNVPSGPYFNLHHQVFAPRIVDLTSGWLRFDQRERGTPSQDYLLVLPDLRAFFEEITPTEEGLIIRAAVAQETGGLSCALAGDTARKDQLRMVVSFEGDTAIVPIPADLNSCQIYLIAPDGEVLDEFSENAWGRSWGTSVLQRPSDTPTYLELNEALQSGETDVVEFKEWIAAAPRDKKSFEVIETTIAFSNTKGGTIYIGINDNAEPTGLEKPLRECYEKAARGDTDAMKDAYIRDLRKVITEGVQPSVSVIFEWIDMAKLPILKVYVPRSEDVVHSAVQTGQIYVRAGATNRKVRHDDMLSLLSRRQARGPDGGGQIHWGRGRGVL